MFQVPLPAWPIDWGGRVGLWRQAAGHDAGGSHRGRVYGQQGALVQGATCRPQTATSGGGWLLGMVPGLLKAAGITAVMEARLTAVSSRKGKASISRSSGRSPRRRQMWKFLLGRLGASATKWCRRSWRAVGLKQNLVEQLRNCPGVSRVSRKKQMRRSLSRVENLIWKRSFQRQGMQPRSLKSAWQREPRRMTRKRPGNQQSVRGRSHLQRAEKKRRGLARDHDPVGVVVAGADPQGDGRRGRVHQLRPQGGHPAQEESCLEETEVAREVTGIKGPLEVEKPLTSRRALTRGRSLFGTPLQIQRPWTRCIWFSNE